MFFCMRKNLAQEIIISGQSERKSFQNNQKKEGAKSLRANHIISKILQKAVSSCKRISFRPFSKSHRKTASMTVEAAMVLPLFLFAVMNLISFIEIYRMQGNVNMNLHQTVKEAAALGAAADIADEEECIDIVYPYAVKPFAPVAGFRPFMMYGRMRTRAWTGYDNERAAKTEAERIVYITEYGKVYHRTKSCAYLKLSIRAVDVRTVETLRNADGGCFYPCEKCGGSTVNTVFVTSYGSRYHTTLNCEGIKRNIKEIPLSQIHGREPCKKCS